MNELLEAVKDDNLREGRLERIPITQTRERERGRREASITSRPFLNSDFLLQTHHSLNPTQPKTDRPF